jgi:glycosyltransferase involved in cell wall biosynthesis
MNEANAGTNTAGPIGDILEIRPSVSASRTDLLQASVAEKPALAAELDLDFYGEYYRDLSGLTSDQLLEHWSSAGRRDGRHPNLSALMQALLVTGELPEGFDVASYLALNPDVAAARLNPWDAVSHYLEFGRPENRQYQFVSTVDIGTEPFDSPGRFSELSDEEVMVLNQVSAEGHPAVRMVPGPTGLDVSTRAVEPQTSPLSPSHEGLAGLKKTAPDAALADTEPREAREHNTAAASDELNTAFYTSYYSDDLGGLKASEATRHWVLHGKNEGRLPNVDAMIRNHINARNFPTDFDVAGYLSANTDLIGKFSSDWEYILHYLDTGIGDQRRYRTAIIDFDFIEALYDVRLNNNAAQHSEKAGVREREIEGHTDRLRTEIEEEIRQRTDDHRVYFDLKSMLFAHGVYNAEIIKIFDYEYYFYKNPSVRGELQKPVPAKCLRHFCAAGLKLGLPFSENYTFDYHFYLDRYPKIGQLSIAKAYLHWINVGYRQGWAPNARLWLQHELGTAIPDPAVFDVELYRATNADLATITDRLETIVHVLKHGVHEARYSVKPTIADSSAFTAIADQLSIRGAYVDANTIYEKVLNQVPTAAEARQHHADNLLRQKQHLAAAAFYRILIDRNECNIWSFINAASCYKAIGDLRRAACTLQEGSLRFPEDMGLRRRVGDAVDEYFRNEWHIAWQEAGLGRATACQERVQRLCRDITPAAPDELPVRPISSIAIVGDEALSQCRLYRIEQKIEQLSAAGFTVKRYEVHADTASFLAEIANYQAVIFYRVPAFPRVVEAIIRSRELGLATIYEVDDLIFEAEHYPTPIETYRGQVTSEEYAGLVVGVPAFAHAMSMCDYGIASTPTLVAEMAKFVRSGRVFLHRNALGLRHDSEMSLPALAPATDRIVIFYGSGTKAHKEDFEELIEPALIELVRRYGRRISIVTVGHISWTPASRAIRDNILQVEPTADIAAYWNLLRTADINLAVLKPSLMADCKSEIKWLEAAMFGVPSVVSRTAAFAEVVEDGVTGFLCNDVSDWVETLDRLVRDRRLRRKVGQAARRAVLERYGIARMKENLVAIFAELSPPRSPRPTIVIVNVFYPPQAKGGATRVAYDNIARLHSAYAEEFEIEVFTTIEGGLSPYETRVYAHDGVRVTGVTTPDEPQIDHKLFDKRMGEIFDKYLKSLSPTMIHFHCVQRLTVAVIDAARQRNIPYLITAHDGYWISDHQFIIDSQDQPQLYDYANPIGVMATHGRETQLRMSMLQKALQGARHVLCVSQAFARLYEQCHVPNVMALPNGVSALPKAVRCPSEDGRVRLAHLGGAMRHKGLHLVKYALLSEEFNHLRLTIVDHAQTAGYLCREVWGTTPVDIVGMLPQKDVGELYARIDVLLAPSVWPESYGLVTREALACGCWVVASDRGAVSEYVVDGENGFVVDVDGIDGLVGALRKIDTDHRRYLESPATPPHLRQASEQADDLAQLYRRMILGDGPRDALGDSPDAGRRRRPKRTETAQRSAGPEPVHDQM